MNVHCGIKRFICWQLTGLAGNMRAQLAEKLEAAGMENVKAVRTEQGWVASFEDRLYRSSYEGVGKAVEAALACETAGQETVLVVTDENGIPVLRIGLPGEVAESYRAGNCGLKEVFRGHDAGHGNGRGAEGAEGNGNTEPQQLETGSVRVSAGVPGEYQF